MGVYDYHHDSGRSDRPGGIPTLYGKQPEVTPENPYKDYVRVQADFSESGQMIPLRIIWHDGRTYEIDHVEDCCRKASMKAGGVGMRYLCRIRGQLVELFYEENGRWFVSRK